MRPIIAGIIHAENFPSLIEAPLESSPGRELALCGILEFRADTFPKSEIGLRLRQIRQKLSQILPQKPKLLLTIRLPQDGGSWKESPERREPIWEESLDQGLADWIDLEIEQINTHQAALENWKNNHSFRWILSHHNFQQGYPLQIFQKKISEMIPWAPDAIKFAVTAQSPKELADLLSISATFKSNQVEGACISMGEWGPISRLASPMLGASLTYGFFGEKGVVPGQISVKNLVKYFKLVEDRHIHYSTPEEWIDFWQGELNGD